MLAPVFSATSCQGASELWCFATDIRICRQAGGQAVQGEQARHQDLQAGSTAGQARHQDLHVVQRQGDRRQQHRHGVVMGARLAAACKLLVCAAAGTKYGAARGTWQTAPAASTLAHTSSPGFRLCRPQPWATMFRPSVALRVNTISSGRLALTKLATLRRAPS
jgi:hypothetical protein